MTVRIFIFSIFFCIGSLRAQTSFKYKSLLDTVFAVGDKIKCPPITWRLSAVMASYEYPPFKESVGHIARFLKANPKLKVELGGHTNSQGDKSADMVLSRSRMVYVKEYLVHDHGIDSSRIRAKGYGSTLPIISDKIIATKKNGEEKDILYSENRRTEITIIGTQ